MRRLKFARDQKPCIFPGLLHDIAGSGALLGVFVLLYILRISVRYRFRRYLGPGSIPPLETLNQRRKPSDLARGMARFSGVALGI